MTRTRCAMTFLGLALISPTAFAQPSAPTPNTTSAGPTTSGRFLSQVEPEKWRTFKLKGLDVYNSNNEHVGDIRELLPDHKSMS